MPGGPLKKHPTSGALLLNPLRQLARCGCCGRCEYAIRAEPCWQEMDVDCDTTIAPLWFCTNSKCFGSEETLGQTKTSVVFLYTAPGDEERCWQTIPGSVTLVDLLDPEDAAAVRTDTALECLEDGCTSSECPAPEDVCPCVCRSLDEDAGFTTDCCMSRLVHGKAPWTFEFSHVIEAWVTRENRDGGLVGGGCVSDDCRESRTCQFFRYEAEVDAAELAASYTPIIEQGCTKTVPLRERIFLEKLGLEPPSPFSFACCAEPDTGTATWSAAGTLTVDPPSTIPETVDVIDTGIITEDGCTSRSLETLTRSGDCTYYHSELVEETWTYTVEGGVCKCQEYQRQVTTTHYDFFPATDEMTLRLCAQCDAAEALL